MKKVASEVKKKENLEIAIEGRIYLIFNREI